MDTEERVNASSSEEREQGLHLSSFISCCPRASQVSFTRAVTAYTWPNTSASNGQVARTHMLSLSHTHTHALGIIPGSSSARLQQLRSQFDSELEGKISTQQQSQIDMLKATLCNFLNLK